MVLAFEIASAVRVMFGPALKTLLFVGAVRLTIISSRLHTFTAALTELGALGVVPRYCAVMVRAPAVVGSQFRPAVLLAPELTLTSPSSVPPSRKRTLPQLPVVQPSVASHGMTPPAVVATLTCSS